MREPESGQLRARPLSLALFQIKRVIQATTALQDKAKHDEMTVKVLETRKL